MIRSTDTPSAGAGFLLIILSIIIFSLSTTFLVAGDTGIIKGKVMDKSGSPLPGAKVVIKGTNYSVITDINGEYFFPSVLNGEYSMEVKYLGLGEASVSVSVVDGNVAQKNILVDVKIHEEMTVVGEPMKEGQAKALNQQKNSSRITNIVASDLIGSFPDPNSAEAAQRLPGISVQRDQGEGRYVLIRGTEARLNSMMLNGERLPSPEGDIRNVALDVIPAELLDSIEVSKTLTSDMDADAIGGTVNLKTRKALAKPLMNLNLGMGYNDISAKTLQNGSLMYSRRFANDKIGLVIGGSYYNTDRGSENFEAEYDERELDDLQLRDYTINRKRIGFSVNTDFILSPATDLTIHGVYNKYDDQEYRRRTRYRLGKERMEKEIKDRFESQQIYSIKGKLKHMFGNGMQMKVSLAYSYANEDEPDRKDITFRHKDIVFKSNVTANSIDPDNIQANPQNEDISKYKMDDLVVENNYTSEKDWVGKIDLDIPVKPGKSFSGMIKTGFKYKNKKKMRNNEATVYEADDDIMMSDFLSGWSAGGFIDGRYDPGKFFGKDTADRILKGGYKLESGKDMESDLADYNAKENTFAGYLMTKLFIGDKLTIIPGVRYENTDIDYTGYEMVFDDGGDFDTTKKIKGNNKYGIILPGLNMVYNLDSKTNIRFAVTRSLARPNYYDLTPYRLVLREDLEIDKGNSDLKPTKSWNVDLMVSRYFSSTGNISAGIFYKNLSDYIYDYRFKEVMDDGNRYKVKQPRNGESAKLWGVETSIQTSLSFLPKPFDGLSIFFNYTYCDSEAEFPDRTGNLASLPGQAKHMANAALSYERGIFSAKVSLNYHGKYIDEVGDTSDEDKYYKEHMQLDLSASVKVAKNVRIYAQMVNITDEPLVYYVGNKNYPVQSEWYSFWGTLGIKITL